MLILASQSPRRQEILRRAGFCFRTITPAVEELPRPDESAHSYVRRLASAKAAAVVAALADTESAHAIVLAADTVVAVDTHILEKPQDAAQAEAMLRLLQGRAHQVLTGICLRRGSRQVVDVAETAVWFAPLAEEAIRWYVASGEPFDKAGGYAIQGLASRFVTRIEGCYYNVVGLPVALVWEHLRRLGWETETDA